MPDIQQTPYRTLTAGEPVSLTVYNEPQQQEQESAGGGTEAFLTAAKGNIVPTIGGVIGSALGIAATAGLEIGSGGTLTPFLIPIAAGLAGGFLGGAAGATAQEIISPTTEEEEETIKKLREEHPTAFALGELAPSFLFFGVRSPRQIYKLAKTTSLLTEAGNVVPPYTKALIQEAAIGAGVSAVAPLVPAITSGEMPTKEEIITSALGGALLTRPRLFTKKAFSLIGEYSQKLAAKAFGPESEYVKRMPGAELGRDYLDARHILSELDKSIIAPKKIETDFKDFDERYLGTIQNQEVEVSFGRTVSASYYVKSLMPEEIRNKFEENVNKYLGIEDLNNFTKSFGYAVEGSKAYVGKNVPSLGAITENIYKTFSEIYPDDNKIGRILKDLREGKITKEEAYKQISYAETAEKKINLIPLNNEGKIAIDDILLIRKGLSSDPDTAVSLVNKIENPFLRKAYTDHLIDILPETHTALLLNLPKTRRYYTEIYDALVKSSGRIARTVEPSEIKITESTPKDIELAIKVNKAIAKDSDYSKMVLEKGDIELRKSAYTEVQGNKSLTDNATDVDKLVYQLEKNGLTYLVDKDLVETFRNPVKEDLFWLKTLALSNELNTQTHRYIKNINSDERSILNLTKEFVNRKRMREHSDTVILNDKASTELVGELFTNLKKIGYLSEDTKRRLEIIKREILKYDSLNDTIDSFKRRMKEYYDDETYNEILTELKALRRELVKRITSDIDKVAKPFKNDLLRATVTTGIGKYNVSGLDLKKAFKGFSGLYYLYHSLPNPDTGKAFIVNPYGKKRFSIRDANDIIDTFIKSRSEIEDKSKIGDQIADFLLKVKDLLKDSNNIAAQHVAFNALSETVDVFRSNIPENKILDLSEEIAKKSISKDTDTSPIGRLREKILKNEIDKALSQIYTKEEQVALRKRIDTDDISNDIWEKGVADSPEYIGDTFSFKKVISKDALVGTKLIKLDDEHVIYKELAKRGIDAIDLGEGKYLVLRPFTSSTTLYKDILAKNFNKLAYSIRAEYYEKLRKARNVGDRIELKKQMVSKIARLREIANDITKAKKADISYIEKLYNEIHNLEALAIKENVKDLGLPISERLKVFYDPFAYDQLLHISFSKETLYNDLKSVFPENEFPEFYKRINAIIDDKNVPDEIKETILYHALKSTPSVGMAIITAVYNNLPISITSFGNQINKIINATAERYGVKVLLPLIKSNEYKEGGFFIGQKALIAVAGPSQSITLLLHEASHNYVRVLNWLYANKKLTPLEEKIYLSFIRKATELRNNAKNVKTKVSVPYGIKSGEYAYTFQGTKLLQLPEELICDLISGAMFERMYTSPVRSLEKDLQIIKRINDGTATIEDYASILARKLLYDPAYDVSNITTSFVASLPSLLRGHAKALQIALESHGFIRDFTSPTAYFSGYVNGAIGVDIARPAKELIDDIILSRRLGFNGGVMEKVFLQYPKLRSLLNTIKSDYGVVGKYLGLKAEKFFEIRDILIGRFYNPIVDLLKNVSQQDRIEIGKILREEREKGISLRNKVPEKLLPVYDRIRDLLTEIAAHHKAYNMPVWEYQKGKATKARHMIEYPYYYPDIIDTKVMDILLNKPGTPEWQKLKDDFINYTSEKLREKENLSEEKAKEIAKEIFGNILRASATGQRLSRGITGEYNALRVEMGVGLPESWRNSDPLEVLSRYTLRVSHDMALHNAIQVDPLARLFLGIREDPWGIPTNSKLIIDTLAMTVNKFDTEYYSKMQQVFDLIDNPTDESIESAKVILNEIKEDEIPDSASILRDTIKRFKESVGVDNDTAKAIFVEFTGHLNTVRDILSYIEKNAENLPLSTPTIQQLMKILYRDISNSEITFHAATSLFKSLMIGAKAKIRDIFNNFALLVGYSQVPIKGFPTMVFNTVKFLADGRSFEQAFRMGFARTGGSSVQEFVHFIGGESNSLAKKLLWLRDLALNVLKTESLEEFSRAIALATSEAAVHYHIVNARGEGRSAVNSRKFIEHFFKTKYDPNKVFSMDEIEMASVRLAQTAQGTYDARDLPSWMLENSYTSAVFTLAKWSIGQTNRFIENTAKFGSRTTLMLLLGSVVSGILGTSLMKELFGKRSNTATIEELIKTPEKERLASEALYSLTALVQWSGYAGIITDIIKMAQDALKGEVPQGYQAPLYEQVVDFLDSSFDAISAILNGENALEVISAYTLDIVKNQVQTLNALLSMAAVRYESGTGVLGREKRRITDANLKAIFRLYNRLAGYPQVSSSMYLSNRYLNLDTRKFREATVPEEIFERYPGALENVFERVGRGVPLSTAVSSVYYRPTSWSPGGTLETVFGSPKGVSYLNWLLSTVPEEEQEQYIRRLNETIIGNTLRKSLMP